MTKRISIRDKMRELVESLPGLKGRVALYKLDMVDKTPFASVYLDSAKSENLHMFGETATMERTLTLNVDFHLDSVTDADAEADSLLESLEALVLSAARNGDIEGVRILFLEEAEFRPTQRGKEKSGDLVTTWVAEYDDEIELTSAD